MHPHLTRQILQNGAFPRAKWPPRDDCVPAWIYWRSNPFKQSPPRDIRTAHRPMINAPHIETQKHFRLFYTAPSRRDILVRIHYETWPIWTTEQAKPHNDGTNPCPSHLRRHFAGSLSLPQFPSRDAIFYCSRPLQNNAILDDPHGGMPLHPQVDRQVSLFCAPSRVK